MTKAFGSIIVVGAGKMGGALVDGWLKQGTLPEQIRLIDPVFASVSVHHGDFASKGIKCFATLDALLDCDATPADLLMLAIKPQMMSKVLPGLRALDHGSLCVLSIAAGTTLEQLQNHFPQSVCIRSMPNTPAAIGKGMSAAYGPGASAQQRSAILALLEGVGRSVWVDDERLIDAVTAVSGSGPAYVFHMVEAMARAGEKLGLDKETAMLLARQTIVGAGSLLEASEQSAEQLRINVTSPGGTTAAGLDVLQTSGRLEELMGDTTLAAFERSIALSSSD